MPAGPVKWFVCKAGKSVVLSCCWLWNERAQYGVRIAVAAEILAATSQMGLIGKRTGQDFLCRSTPVGSAPSSACMCWSGFAHQCSFPRFESRLLVTWPWLCGGRFQWLQVISVPRESACGGPWWESSGSACPFTLISSLAFLALKPVPGSGRRPIQSLPMIGLSWPLHCGSISVSCGHSLGWFVSTMCQNKRKWGGTKNLTSQLHPFQPQFKSRWDSNWASQVLIYVQLPCRAGAL